MKPAKSHVSVSTETFRKSKKNFSSKKEKQNVSKLPKEYVFGLSFRPMYLDINGRVIGKVQEIFKAICDQIFSLFI